MSNAIAKALGIAVETPPSAPGKLPESPEGFDADFRVARDNYYTLLKDGMIAVQDLATVAKESKQPQYYDALTRLLKALAEINTDLMTLTEKRMEIERGSSAEERSTPDSAFVGSTAELLSRRKAS